MFFLPVEQGELGDRSFLWFSSGRLYHDHSHQTIFTRVGLDDPGYGPTTGKVVLRFHDHNVSLFQVWLSLLPLGPGLEGVQVLPGPSCPEVLDDGLALIPSL